MASFLSKAASATLALLIAAPLAHSDNSPPYRISAIREYNSTEWIRVKKEWRKDLPKRILVTIRVNADTSSHGFILKAYFYDKDNNLVHKANQPDPVWGKPQNAYGGQNKDRIGEIALPGIMKKAIPTNVYFAIPEAAIEGKWKSVVVVFGRGTDLVGRSFPQKAIEEANFPEKKHINLNLPLNVFDN